MVALRLKKWGAITSSTKKTLKFNFIADIVERILPILKKNGVKKAAVFGSLTRGSKKKSSDLDLLVEMKQKGLLERARLKRKLEEAIQREVDVGTFGAIYHGLREHILNEAIYIL